MDKIDEKTEFQRLQSRHRDLQARTLELQDTLTVFYKREAAAIQAIQHTQDRMQQLHALITALPPDEKQGRLLRIVELADIVSQGIDTIESALQGFPEAA